LNVTDAYRNSSTNTINIKNSNSSHIIIYSVGNNNWGQLGIGNTTDQSTPQEITFLSNKIIKNITCGLEFTLLY
jgi:alpha-tubulin suppressor-like RCC1 family protein